MTLPNEARAAVYSRFIALWTGGTAYTFENEKFAPPKDAAWVRLSVRNLESAQDCLGPPGARRFRRDALVFAQVFVPLDGGLAVSDSLVSDLQGIFEGVSFDGLDFRAVSSREIGVDEAWHLTLVEAPFDYEEIK